MLIAPMQKSASARHREHGTCMNFNFMQIKQINLSDYNGRTRSLASLRFAKSEHEVEFASRGEATLARERNELLEKAYIVHHKPLQRRLI